MTLELIPLCDVDLVLARPLVIGKGPQGMRLVYEVVEGTISGERLRATMKGSAAADWAVVNGTVATLDVRATFETDDGALVFAQYLGRTDVSGGPNSAPFYVAPMFETGDERYGWLNALQAIGKGQTDGNKLHYEWYEVR